MARRKRYCWEMTRKQKKDALGFFTILGLLLYSTIMIPFYLIRFINEIIILIIKFYNNIHNKVNK